MRDQEWVLDELVALRLGQTVQREQDHGVRRYFFRQYQTLEDFPADHHLRGILARFHMTLGDFHVFLGLGSVFTFHSAMPGDPPEVRAALLGSPYPDTSRKITAGKCLGNAERNHAF